MKSIRLLLTVAGVLMLGFYGCYYDKEELLYPSQAQCDTTNVTFSLKVEPIFSANCISCHNASTTEGGIDLHNYDLIKSNINVAYDAIYNGRMPKDAGRLNDCSINTIRIWKDAGMPNN